MKKVKNILSLFLLLTIAGTAFAQQKITGTVTDQDNKVIPGTNVIQMGTSKGKVCNWDGNFEIDLPEGEHILLIAFMGYKPYEHRVKVDSHSKVDLEIILVKDERRNRKLQSSGKELRETIVIQ